VAAVTHPQIRETLIATEIESCERFAQRVAQFGVKMPKIHGSGRLLFPWPSMKVAGAFMVQEFVEFEPLSVDLGLKYDNTAILACGPIH